MLIDRLLAEFRRVFGSDPLLIYSYPADGAACIALETWPAARTYHVMEALAVLRTYRDGAGATESGDETVCADLEQTGAKLSNREFAIVESRREAAEEIESN